MPTGVTLKNLFVWDNSCRTVFTFREQIIVEIILDVVCTTAVHGLGLSQAVVQDVTRAPAK